MKKKSGIHIKKANAGKFRAEVGAKPGKPLTSKQIEKGLHSDDPAERKRANFARNAKKFNHAGKKGK